MKVRKPRVRLHPYKVGSQGCKNLAEALNLKRIAKVSKFKPRAGDTIINWGSSALRVDEVEGCKVINHPSAIKSAANKVLFFRALQGHDDIQTVPSTENKGVAQGWINEGHTVYARTSVTGHSGDGISVHDADGDDLVHAPLYTRAIVGKRREIRLHVFQDEVILVQQKRRREGWQEDENYNDEVRNHGNGWVYSHLNVTEPPPQATEMAVKAVKALGLDFGIVDMITQRGECYILEVNTACGLEGNTVTVYANKFAEVLGLEYNIPAVYAE